MIALLLSPRGKVENQREAKGPIHIEVPVPDGECPDKFVMLCGLVGEEDSDGRLPFDFYLFQHGYKATCRKCRRKGGHP